MYRPLTAVLLASALLYGGPVSAAPRATPGDNPPAAMLQAAARNDPYAQYELANFYSQQPGAQAQRLSMNYYRSAAMIGHTDAQWKLAERLFQMSEGRAISDEDAQRLRKEALALLDHAAEAGNNHAMQLLVHRASAGEGMAVNLQLADHWQRAMADTGDADAAYAVSQRQLSSREASERTTGIHYLTIAANADHPAALMDLAARLATGHDVTPDPEQAKRYAAQAVAAQVPGASELAASLNPRITPPSKVPTPAPVGIGPETARIVVADLVQRPSRVRPLQATDRIAYQPAPPRAPSIPAPITVPATRPPPIARSAPPPTVAPPADAAVAALQKQVESALARVAQLEQQLSATTAQVPPVPTHPMPAVNPEIDGETVNEQALAALRDKDMDRAIGLFQVASERGSVNAMNNLGMLYLRGAGVPKNRDDAVRWFTQAAERGSAVAASNLGYIYSHGLGVSPDIHEAIGWYRKAVAMGHAESVNQLRILQGELPPMRGGMPG